MPRSLNVSCITLVLSYRYLRQSGSAIESVYHEISVCMYLGKVASSLLTQFAGLLMIRLSRRLIGCTDCCYYCGSYRI